MKNLTNILLILIASYLTACSTLPTPQQLQQTKQNLAHCQQKPTGNTCQIAIRYSLYYQAHNPQLNWSNDILSTLYNGRNAKQLFLMRIADIDTRADFFATNHYYFQTTDMPVQWFGASEYISRRCLLGLGAKGCGSKVTFSIAKTLTNPQLNEWRQAVGDSILLQGFPYFKALFQQAQPVKNHSPLIIKNAKQWDIAQLTREQNTAQAQHQKYLPNYPKFIRLSKAISGVDLLDKNSRINYGQQLLKHHYQEKNKNYGD
ncbi:MAG: hypothetical protein KGV51_07235 [Moraxellaceae bacterium]|nr:hypothetical protein [Moraxellaceae bacterium]